MARMAARTEVTLNEDGVLRIDGEKVFPIAFTMPPPPDGKTPDGKNGIEELADAGATFLRTGPMSAPWTEAVFEREHKYQEAAARHGMHCLVNLREAGSIGGEDAGEKEALLRRIVGTFKNHPGLGVWKHVDEPEWGKHPIPKMLRAREIVRALDPHHPIEVTQAPRGTVESLRAYNPTLDIVGMDVYPVGYPPGLHSLLPNKEISMVGDYAKMLKQVVAGQNIPIWMTLQIAWSGVVKPGKTLRFPTFPEERYMTYQSLVNGARGLIYFGGQLAASLTPEDAALGWNWRFWRRVLRPVIEEIGTKSHLYPALLAPESKLPVQVTGVSKADDIEFCVREVGREIFIIACKREGATVEATFRGLPADAGEGEVLFEPPRHVTASKGSFTDWFGPFEVHVYRFSRRVQ